MSSSNILNNIVQLKKKMPMVSARPKMPMVSARPKMKLLSSEIKSIIDNNDLYNQFLEIDFELYGKQIIQNADISDDLKNKIENDFNSKNQDKPPENRPPNILPSSDATFAQFNKFSLLKQREEISSLIQNNPDVSLNFAKVGDFLSHLLNFKINLQHRSTLNPCLEIQTELPVEFLKDLKRENDQSFQLNILPELTRALYENSKLNIPDFFDKLKQFNYTVWFQYLNNEGQLPNDLLKLKKSNQIDNMKIGIIINEMRKNDNYIFYKKIVNCVRFENGCDFIKDLSFCDFQLITDIHFNQNISKIGNQAFSKCSKLQKVTLPLFLKTIGNGSFKQCSSLQKIIIPDSVTNIGENSFSDCSSLAEIVISPNIKCLSNGIFENCSSLKQIIIPDSVNRIGSKAFKGCSSLNEIVIPKSVKEIGEESFSGCSSLNIIKIYCPNINIGKGSFSSCRSLKEIMIPSSIKSIGKNFEECNELRKIIIIDNEKVIEDYALQHLKTVEEIILPSTIEIIGLNSFEGCTSLKELIIPPSVTTIKDSSFHNCCNLTHITIPDSVLEIGSNSFSECSSLEEITLSTNIQSIPNNLFYRCSSLKQIIIPDSVNQIDSKAFEGCSSLEEITILGNIQKLLDNAFYQCKSLKKIVIPQSVQEIGSNSFSGCTSLEEISIPSKVQKLNKGLFYQCESLKKLSIPDSINEISGQVFEKCSSLEEITIPKNITKINERTFAQCKSLRHLVIPESVTEIGVKAFEECSSLKEIIVPQSVTVIGEGAFSKCSSLEKIELPMIKIIPSYLFNECNLLSNIIIPKTVTAIGEYSFNKCSSLINIDIPYNVKIIPEYAFAECKSLTNVLIPTTVKVLGKSAFQGCRQMKEFSLESIQILSESCFRGCESIEKVIIHSKIPDDIFNGCSSLKKVDISYNAKKIGDRAFSGCTSLKDIFIPDSITDIGADAFYACSSLERVYFSSNLKTIGACAFCKCRSLRQISIPNSVTNVDEYAFNKCLSLQDLTISSDTVLKQFSFDEGIITKYNLKTIKSLPILDNEVYERVLIFDIGTNCFSYGFAGESSPRRVPTQIAYNKYADNKTPIIGDQFLANVYNVHKILDHGYIKDFDGLLKIIEYAYNILKVSPEEYPVLITGKPLVDKGIMFKLAEEMFTYKRVPALYMCNDAVLSLYASGRTTGIVLDSGNETTQVVPVYEGYSIPHATLRYNFGGNDVTNYLKDILRERGYELTSLDERIALHEIKENLCYVAQDYDRELYKANNTTECDETWEIDENYEITISSERFRCTELLFNPSLHGLDCDGFDASIYNSIMKCDIDIRDELYKNIVIAGGNTMFTGLKERLENEIEVRQNRRTKVIAEPERGYGAWFGGSIFACSPSFNQYLITKDEYNGSITTLQNTFII